MKKGESLRDTVLTIEAMGVDAIVVRHASAGVPWQIAAWLDDRVSVVNAGDGWHEHPTQALLDSYTIREERGALDGMHIGIVGDVKHSRVARSDVFAYTALGAEVTLVAPPTLLPPSLEGWPVRVAHDLDAVLPSLDVVYLLRMQKERMTEHLVPSLREYTSRYGLTSRRVDVLRDDALVMHPGPMNRGVEISAEVADLPRSVIIDQVRNGVATRMAVLYLLLGCGVGVRGGGVEDDLELGHLGAQHLVDALPEQQVQHRHASGDAVAHLVDDHRARQVGDLGADLDAAVHRPRVHHEGVVA